MKKENKDKENAEKNPLSLFDGEEPLPEVLAIAYGKAHGFDPIFIWDEYQRQIIRSRIAQFFIFTAIAFAFISIFFYNTQIDLKKILIFTGAVIVPLMYIVFSDQVIMQLEKESSMFHDYLDMFRDQFSDLIQSETWKEADFEGEAGFERFREMVLEDLERYGVDLLAREYRSGRRQDTQRNNLNFKALCANKFCIPGDGEDILKRIKNRKSVSEQAEVSEKLSSTLT